MITSLYENNFPMRFGVVLYSSKFIKQIETSGSEDDSKIEEDISSLVISSLPFLFCRSFVYLISSYALAVESIIPNRGIKDLHNTLKDLVPFNPLTIRLGLDARILAWY